MATMPPPAPVAPRPGAATGAGTTQPLPNGLRPQPRIEPEFRPVQPQTQPQSEYRPASPNRN
jgi:general secretion pathway protein D